MIGFEINNLEHRSDRKNICIGNFMTQGVPYEDVTFHKAIWGGDYPNAKAVCDAAVADGFPEFAEGCEMGGRGDAAAHWGMMRIFEHIASEEYPYEFGYFNQDDRLLPPSIYYDDLVNITRILAKDPNFLYFQLSWHPSAFAEDPIRVELRQDKFLTYHDKKIYKGIFSYGDSGLILSKKGARYVRERFAETKNWFEALILEEGNVPGTYALWEPFDFIIKAEWCGFNSEEEAQDRIVVNKSENLERKIRIGLPPYAKV